MRALIVAKDIDPVPELSACLLNEFASFTQVGTMERVYHFMPRSVCGDLAEDGVVKLHKEGRRHCLSRRALVPRDDALHAMLNSQANVCAFTNVACMLFLVLRRRGI